MTESAISAIRAYFFRIRRGLRSNWSALWASLPYLFNRNPNSLHKEVTEQYPDPVSAKTADDLPPRTRGLLFNKIEECIGCHECAKVCPVNAIEIASEKHIDTGKEWVSSFVIDHGQCVYCGLCVEVCPTNSLIHTRAYERARVDIDGLKQEFGKGEPPRRGEFS